MKRRIKIINLVLSNIKRKYSRSAILIVSVALLIFMFTFFILILATITTSLEKFSSRLGADVIVVPQGAGAPGEEFLLEAKVRQFYMKKDLYDKIREFEGIEKITYQTFVGVLDKNIKVIAIDPETDFIIKPWVENKKLNKGEVFLGAEAYKYFGNIKKGDMIKIFGKDFKVADIMDKTKTGMDYSVFITEEDMIDLIKENPNINVREDQISVILIKSSQEMDAGVLAYEIENGYPQVDTIYVKKIGEKVRKFISNMSKIFSVVLVVSSVLSVLLIANIFTMIINERRREIGILRALGASNRGVMKVLLLESVFLGIIGSSLGIIFGLILGWKLLSSLKMPFIEINMVIVSLIVMAGIAIGVAISGFGVSVSLIKIRKIEPLTLIKGE